MTVKKLLKPLIKLNLDNVTYSVNLMILNLQSDYDPDNFLKIVKGIGVKDAIEKYGEYQVDSYGIGDVDGYFDSDGEVIGRNVHMTIAIIKN